MEVSEIQAENHKAADSEQRLAHLTPEWYPLLIMYPLLISSVIAFSSCFWKMPAARRLLLCTI